MSELPEDNLPVPAAVQPPRQDASPVSSNRQALTQIHAAMLIDLKGTAGNFRGFIETHIGNVHLGGMFLKTHRPKPIGTAVRVRLPYNGGRNTCEVEGTVMRTVQLPEVTSENPDAGMAVEFGRMEITSRALLRKVIMEYLVVKGYPAPLDPNNPRPPEDSAPGGNLPAVVKPKPEN